MKDIIKETREKMHRLADKRNEQIRFLTSEIDKARKEKDAAKQALEKAFESMDPAAISPAKTRLSAAEEILDLCETRRNRFSSEFLISESESDAIIDRILAYEQDLCLEYDTEISPILAQLSAITKAHQEKIREAESVISAWNQNVHPNFRSFTGTIYPNGTNRGEEAQPVHRFAYVGSESGKKVSTFLRDMDEWRARQA